MRLNKTQKYAINWLVSQDTEIKEIVKELKLQIACVQSYIDKHLKEQKASIKEHQNSEVAKITSKDLMIRHTSNKSNNTVAIMTKEASEINDSNRKKQSAKVRDTSHIFRMTDETT